MPLINDTGFVADSWVRAGDEALASTLSPHGIGCLEEAGEGSEKNIIVPFARLEEVFPSSLVGEGAQRADEGSKKLGINIPNTTLPSTLTPYLNQLTLISIDFPSFSDGRGFSIARAIRNSGFTGELRAYGPLVADQYAYALSCGFDTIEIPDDLATRQPEAQWKAAYASMSSSYQRSFVHGKNILDQRDAGNQPSLLPLREKVARSEG